MSLMGAHVNLYTLLDIGLASITGNLIIMCRIIRKMRFGDTPFPDPLYSQYVTAHMVSPMDGVFFLLDGGKFDVSHYVFVYYAYCFASKKF